MQITRGFWCAKRPNWLPHRGQMTMCTGQLGFDKVDRSVILVRDIWRAGCRGASYGYQSNTPSWKDMIELEWVWPGAEPAEVLFPLQVCPWLWLGGWGEFGCGDTSSLFSIDILSPCICSARLHRLQFTSKKWKSLNRFPQFLHVNLDPEVYRIWQHLWTSLYNVVWSAADMISSKRIVAPLHAKFQKILFSLGLHTLSLTLSVYFRRRAYSFLI